MSCVGYLKLYLFNIPPFCQLWWFFLYGTSFLLDNNTMLILGLTRSPPHHLYPHPRPKSIFSGSAPECPFKLKVHDMINNSSLACKPVLPVVASDTVLTPSWVCWSQHPSVSTLPPVLLAELLCVPDQQTSSTCMTALTFSVTVAQGQLCITFIIPESFPEFCSIQHPFLEFLHLCVEFEYDSAGVAH